MHRKLSKFTQTNFMHRPELRAAAEPKIGYSLDKALVEAES